jgi:hypothetical protein
MESVKSSFSSCPRVSLWLLYSIRILPRREHACDSVTLCLLCEWFDSNWAHKFHSLISSAWSVNITFVRLVISLQPAVGWPNGWAHRTGLV